MHIEVIFATSKFEFAYFTPLCKKFNPSCEIFHILAAGVDLEYVLAEA